MYDSYRQRPEPDWTDWRIFSPDVPIFRNGDGIFVSSPWPETSGLCDQSRTQRDCGQRSSNFPV